MLEIFYQYNTACVYSATVWETLRKEHRIVGKFVGSSSKTPSLPVELLHEETILLVNKGICRLIYPPEVISTDVLEKQYQNLQKRLLATEQVLFKERRLEQLGNLVDKILDGKRKKNSSATLSKDELLEEELSKSCSITDTNMVWPIFTVPPFPFTAIDAPLSEVLIKTTSNKCKIFSDLWDKGYYITSGFKFGGDFLVYLGDPILYHAVYIVRCVENPDVKQHASEIVAFGRLGSSVKKRAILASVNDENTVSYITLNWLYS